MDTFVDRKFEDESLFIDLASFERCTFIRCELTYAGGGAADFQDCIFEDCSWTFEGSAVRTIDFLASVYRRTGKTGQDLVEGIFDSIRNSPVIDIRDEGRIKARESVSVKTTLAS